MDWSAKPEGEYSVNDMRYSLEKRRLKSVWAILDHTSSNCIDFSDFILWWLRNSGEIFILDTLVENKGRARRRNSILHERNTIKGTHEDTLRKDR